MLWNLAWEKMPTIAREFTTPEHDLEYDGITLRGFIAWLEKQPADKTYSFMDADRCALGQYTGRRIDIPSNHWLAEILINETRTFGEALERARKFAAVHV